VHLIYLSRKHNNEFVLWHFYKWRHTDTTKCRKISMSHNYNFNLMSNSVKRNNVAKHYSCFGICDIDRLFHFRHYCSHPTQSTKRRFVFVNCKSAKHHFISMNILRLNKEWNYSNFYKTKRLLKINIQFQNLSISILLSSKIVLNCKYDYIFCHIFEI
jgi:hypothetical protein